MSDYAKRSDAIIEVQEAIGMDAWKRLGPGQRIRLIDVIMTVPRYNQAPRVKPEKLQEMAESFVLGGHTEAEIRGMLQRLVDVARQEPVGDALEITIKPEVMKFVLDKIRASRKTISQRILEPEWVIHEWTETESQVEIWKLKILAKMTRKFNWMVFLLQPENLPGKK